MSEVHQPLPKATTFAFTRRDDVDLVFGNCQRDLPRVPYPTLMSCDPWRVRLTYRQIAQVIPIAVDDIKRSALFSAHFDDVSLLIVPAAVIELDHQILSLGRFKLKVRVADVTSFVKHLPCSTLQVYSV